MSELALQRIQKIKKSKAKSLDLNDCDLRELPEEIISLEWLEKLDLWGEKISDLSPVVGLGNLRVLDIRRTQVTNLQRFYIQRIT